MPKRTLESMAEALYEDPAIAEFVVKQIRDASTEDAVLNGERVLPHPIDARRNWEIAEGIYGSTETEREQASRLKQLEQRIAELEGGAKPKAK